MIKLGETHKDGLGRDVRIICVDFVGDDSPVLGVISVNGRDCIQQYMADGKCYPNRKSLSDLILPEDYSTFEIDEPVMVREHDNKAWCRRHFAGVCHGKPTSWAKGVTSWTSVDETAVSWSQCRRPTKEELGEGK